jgi:acetolactate synthase-1/2/3 large subunit
MAALMAHERSGQEARDAIRGPPQARRVEMNGAEVLVHTLLHAGVNTCFANPGTSEMHFVAALDRIEGMRCVLGLFEGVVTGAADGYYRMADRPAATLLHLGPGLANGLANLHNAKKARSGIVNVVGEHATTHLALEAPLTADIEALAGPMSGWVRTIPASGSVADVGREAVVQAHGRPGRISTLVLPADVAWSEAERSGSAERVVEPPSACAVDELQVRAAAEALKAHGSSTLILLGGQAMRGDATFWAARVAAATGCAVMSEFYVERIERGAGRPVIPRLPYGVDAALKVMARFRQVVLVAAAPPVAFFAYPGKPGRLEADGTRFLPLCSHAQDPLQALEALGEAVGACRHAPVLADRHVTREDLARGALSASSIASVLTALIPEDAIVVDEAISTGRAFDETTRHAAPHDWLTNMGGSIGYGLPVAVGAAIACPDRPVIALEGDGSAMYTLQALWTMAREQLNVTVVVFANRNYQILRGEFAQVGAGAPGRRATDMLTLDRPALDWVALGAGHGVPASRATTPGEFADALRRAVSTEGPTLIEVVLA